MFGGLELKGSSGNAPSNTAAAPNGNAQEKTSTPTPSTSSAFSFLNAAATSPATATETAPRDSGFSFLNASTETSPTAAAASPNTSAFSFLATAAAPPTEMSAANDDSEAEVVQATSGLSFLQQPQAVSNVPSTIHEAADATNDNSAVPSGFGFLASSTTNSNTHRLSNTDVTISTISRDSPALSETGLSVASNSAMPDLVTTPSLTIPGIPGPTGTGVTFGAAAASKPKKKRTRAAKVGVAAKTDIPAGMPPRKPVGTSIPEPSGTTTPEYTMSARDEASQATQRAEDFLHQKLQQQQEYSHYTSESVTTLGTSMLQTDPYPSVAVTNKEDDIVTAAKAAAEEAQHLAAGKINHRTLGDRLGGLFRKTSSNSNVPHATITNSNHSGHGTIRGNSMETITAVSGSTVTPLDRLQNEQESVQRAISERQLRMMKEHSSESGLVPASIQTPVGTSFAPPKPTSTFYPPPLEVQKPVSRYVSSPPAVTTSGSQTRKSKSSMDVFKEMMLDFHNRVVKNMEEVMRLRSHRSGLLQERFVTVAKERYATQQKAQAELQLQAAAEAEDFELAAKMDSEIQAHERERMEYTSILGNITAALKELDAQKVVLVEKVTHCFPEIQAKLKVFREEEETKETADTTEALKRFSGTSKSLSAEHERLQQDLKHLERDAQLVADERKELETAISEQAGEYERLRDEAKTKLTQVEEEIEELRKKLSAKMAVASQLRTEAAGHDEAVLRVRVKFSRQLTRVQKKEATIQDNREEWDLEKRSYEASKERHDTEVTAHSEALLARDKLIEALNTEVEMADTFESIVAKEIGFEASAQEESEMDDELAQMQAEVVKCEAAVNEAKQVFKIIVNELQSLQEEKSELEARIPQLEEMKKNAAGRRDFKVASQASKDAKEATARLREVEEELANGAQEKVKLAEAAVDNLNKGLHDKQQIAHAREKESGLRAMRRLADNIKRLVATKESVCKDSDDHSIQVVGAFVLDGQIKALHMEGVTYGEKYGGWDELMEEIGFNVVTEDSFKPKRPSNIESSQAGRFQDKESKNVNESVSVVNESEPTQEQESKDEQLIRFRHLTEKIKEAEESIESAVANEDFEKAADCDEIMQTLLVELQTFDLTDEEMDRALSETVGQTTLMNDQTPEKAANKETLGETESREEISDEAGRCIEEQVDGETAADAAITSGNDVGDTSVPEESPDETAEAEPAHSSETAGTESVGVDDEPNGEQDEISENEDASVGSNGDSSPAIPTDAQGSDVEDGL